MLWAYSTYNNIYGFMRNVQIKKKKKLMKMSWRELPLDIIHNVATQQQGNA